MREQTMLFECIQEDHTHTALAALVGTISVVMPAYNAARTLEVYPMGTFVKVGDTISVDQTLCIIEAMKVMNEIKAERSGTITAVLAEEGTPVQYGDPLFGIK